MLNFIKRHFNHYFVTTTNNNGKSSFSWVDGHLADLERPPLRRDWVWAWDANVDSRQGHLFDPTATLVKIWRHSRTAGRRPRTSRATICFKSAPSPHLAPQSSPTSSYSAWYDVIKVSHYLYRLPYLALPGTDLSQLSGNASITLRRESFINLKHNFLIINVIFQTGVKCFLFQDFFIMDWKLIRQSHTVKLTRS